MPFNAGFAAADFSFVLFAKGFSSPNRQSAQRGVS